VPRTAQKKSSSLRLKRLDGGSPSALVSAFGRCFEFLLSFSFFCGGVVYFGFDFFGNITHKDFNGHGTSYFFGSTVKIAKVSS